MIRKISGAIGLRTNEEQHPYPIMKQLPEISFPTPQNRDRRRGFSLLELMTVVSIMAALAAISFPGIRAAMTNAQMAQGTANIRSIAQGLRAWAADNEGVFPVEESFHGEEIVSANDAFRELVPEYIDNEKIFALARSARGPKADNRIDERDEILEPGENHYAYVAGLHDTSRSNWPLVVDGTDGSGYYVQQRGSKGGAWEGNKALVAYIGGNAEAVRLRGEDDRRYLPREGYPEENALAVEYMGNHVELLEAEDE